MVESEKDKHPFLMKSGIGRKLMSDWWVVAVLAVAIIISTVISSFSDKESMIFLLSSVTYVINSVIINNKGKLIMPIYYFSILIKLFIQCLHSNVIIVYSNQIIIKL